MELTLEQANLVGLLAVWLETNRYHEIMGKTENLLALREILNYKTKPGGSKPGKASNKPSGAEQIRLDCFVDEPALGPDASSITSSVPTNL